MGRPQWDLFSTSRCEMCVESGGKLALIFWACESPPIFPHRLWNWSPLRRKEKGRFSTEFFPTDYCYEKLSFLSPKREREKEEKDEILL